MINPNQYGLVRSYPNTISFDVMGGCQMVGPIFVLYANQKKKEKRMSFTRRDFITSLGAVAVTITAPSISMANVDQKDIISLKKYNDFKKALEKFMEEKIVPITMFEYNDIYTRFTASKLVNKFCRDYKKSNKNTLEAFNVVCDERNNPERVINRNEFSIDVYCQFDYGRYSSKKINFTMYGTGVKLSDNS